MGVPPAKLHEKLDALGGACFSLPAGRQAGHAWFFDPVGMGVPPAKLHEKLPFVGQAILPADSLSAGPAACKAAWFFDSVHPSEARTPVTQTFNNFESANTTLYQRLTTQCPPGHPCSHTSVCHPDPRG